MARHRPPEYCPNCGKQLQAQYQDQSNIPFLHRVIGDTFMGYKPCDCVTQKKAEEVKEKEDEKPAVLGEWQLCPKCNGDGNLSRYNSPAIISTDASLRCDVCNGAKIIARPILNPSI